MAQDNGIDLLNNLIKLDVDAVGAYESAIKALDDDREAQERLRTFQADHQRHIRELSAYVSQLGGTPAKASPDVKGFFLKGFTAIRGAFGVRQALEAMKSNEQLTNKTYADALQDPDLPVGCRDLVQKNYQDEQRHLAWITARIDQMAQAPA